MLNNLWKNCLTMVRRTTTYNQKYEMGMLTDKLQKRTNQKQKQQFKKQIDFLANKPTFTILDYKQRINDQLYKLRNNLRNKFNKETQEAEKLLEQERKIMDAFFQEQLIGDKKITGADKKQIALVSEVTTQEVNDVLKKVQKYRKMHLLLRSMKENQLPLPEDSTELNYAYMKSGLEQSSYQNRHNKYRDYSVKKRLRYIKFQDKR